MSEVVMFADTVRSPELRHEVPLAIGDPFPYAERDGVRHAVVGSFEVPRLREVVPDIVGHAFEEYGWDELLARGLRTWDALFELGVRFIQDLGIDSAVVPAAFPVELADRLRGRGIAVTADQELFDRRRRVKNAHELAGIRRAQRAAEAGMQAAAALLRAAERRDGTLLLDGEPLTCERVKLDVERAFSEHGASADQFIVSHGVQTALGHDMGSGPIAPDEPIVLDLFPRDRETGCFADMTRTFVVGTPPPEVEEWHRLSHEALERALEAIRPGVEGREVHRIVCDVFQAHGYPTQLSKAEGEVLLDGFYHSTGHGVGLDVHEEPGLGRSGPALVAGDVVAVEPGLYRQGVGGLRLEDLVLVTDDGCEKLTDFPYDLQP